MKSRDWFLIAIILFLSIANFLLMAGETDRLNARIRQLELRAGMPDPWVRK